MVDTSLTRFFKKVLKMQTQVLMHALLVLIPLGYLQWYNELQKTLISFGLTYEILKYNMVQLYSKIHSLLKKEKKN